MSTESTPTTDSTTTTTATFSDLNAFQRDVLFAAHAYEVDAGDPAIGLEVKEVLEEDLGYSDVNHGRLYPNLGALEDLGFIEKTSVDDRSNSYEVTEAGIAILEDRVQRTASLCGMPVPDTGDNRGEA